jgi:heavy metal sensor kinase
MYSLRRTLAVRFSLTIFVALLLIALWAYIGTQRVLRLELDRALAATLELETTLLSAGPPAQIEHGGDELRHFADAVYRFVVLRDLNGTVVGSNTSLANDLPIDQSRIARAHNGERQWVTATWRGTRVRSVLGPAPPNAPAEVAVVQVAASLEPHGSAARQMLFLMLGTVLLGTVATALGAGWLAGSVVAPVQAITEQASAVTPGTVGHRITAHADVIEYHGLIEVLNEMLDRLDRGLESGRRIIADVGHDLRTPLTAMRGEIEIALRSTRDADTYRAVLESVLEEVDRLSSISEALVLLARLEAGQLTPDRSITDVGALVRRAVERAQGRADGRHIVFSGTQRNITANVDDNMLVLLIDHLLDNAVQHTPSGTRVNVALRAERSAVTITVEDDGPGIPDDVLLHIFERFYRVDSARSRSTGAGLGLTIASAIAEVHGGTIRAERSPLGGLKITLKLPANL